MKKCCSHHDLLLGVILITVIEKGIKNVLWYLYAKPVEGNFQYGIGMNGNRVDIPISIDRTTCIMDFSFFRQCITFSQRFFERVKLPYIFGISRQAVKIAVNGTLASISADGNILV